MQRYFVKNEDFHKNNAIIRDDYHHITKVMRMKLGSELIVCNCLGNCYHGEITGITADEIHIHKLSDIIDTELPISVDICQGLIRREKFEYMLQKATELGVKKIVPFIMDRSIVKIDQKSIEKKIVRWNKITKEASEQAHRNYVTLVDTIQKKNDINYAQYDTIIVCYEEEAKSKSLKKVLNTIQQHSKVLIIIGPEGGITKEEIQFFKEQGAYVCGLGPRILRAETASTYVLSVLSYQFEFEV